MDELIFDFEILPYSLQIFFILCFGLILGSFSNVVLVRWPLGESLSFPGSHCRSTGKPLPWYDNIPVLSYLFLRGKSRFDRSPISLRYPLVELFFGVSFVALYQLHGATWNFVEITTFFYLAGTASLVDLEHFLLPDILQYPGMGLALLFAFLNPDRDLTSALMGMAVGGLGLWSISKAYFLARQEEGLGFGDVKLLAWIGALVGLQGIPVVLFVSSLSGLFVGLIAMTRGKAGLKTALPFGPFLFFGALLVYHLDFYSLFALS